MAQFSLNKDKERVETLQKKSKEKKEKRTPNAIPLSKGKDSKEEKRRNEIKT